MSQSPRIYFLDNLNGAAILMGAEGGTSRLLLKLPFGTSEKMIRYLGN